MTLLTSRRSKPPMMVALALAPRMVLLLWTETVPLVSIVPFTIIVPASSAAAAVFRSAAVVTVTAVEVAPPVVPPAAEAKPSTTESGQVIARAKLGRMPNKRRFVFMVNRIICGDVLLFTYNVDQGR